MIKSTRPHGIDLFNVSAVNGKIRCDVKGLKQRMNEKGRWK